MNTLIDARQQTGITMPQLEPRAYFDIGLGEEFVMLHFDTADAAQRLGALGLSDEHVQPAEYFFSNTIPELDHGRVVVGNFDGETNVMTIYVRNALESARKQAEVQTQVPAALVVPHLVSFTLSDTVAHEEGHYTSFHTLGPEALLEESQAYNLELIAKHRQLYKRVLLGLLALSGAVGVGLVLSAGEGPNTAGTAASMAATLALVASTIGARRVFMKRATQALHSDQAYLGRPDEVRASEVEQRYLEALSRGDAALLVSALPLREFQQIFGLDTKIADYSGF